MKVGIKFGKVKKFGIGWCILHRMAADNAKGGSVRPPPPYGIGLIHSRLRYSGFVVFDDFTYCLKIIKLGI